MLRGLSLRVSPGETLAVVGTSGSGKSTISLLLPRFYDVQRRRGADRRARRPRPHPRLAAGLDRAGDGGELPVLRHACSANIAYGRPNATQEQIVAAARAAEADEFITGLPDGYDTVIGEQGLTLSGGQRQRVALARALITDPRILVLDDATSAIDARVEAQIHATLRRVMAGRTTLLIAHRRSTLQLADRIAVLDEGRLVDAGTHEELTARCPLYRLLLAGPGDDAEGVDAGELECYSDDAARRAAALAGPADGGRARPGGVTPSLWPAPDGDDGAESAATAGPADSRDGSVTAGPGCAPGTGRGPAARCAAGAAVR